MNSNDQNKQEKLVGTAGGCPALLCALCRFVYIQKYLEYRYSGSSSRFRDINDSGGGLVTAYYVGYVAMNFFSGFFALE